MGRRGRPGSPPLVVPGGAALMIQMVRVVVVGVGGLAGREGGLPASQ